MDLNNESRLEKARKELVSLDKQITDLFVRRMDAVRDIADYKKEKNLPVLDSDVERRKMTQIRDMVPEEMREYIIQLYSVIFELSRSYQNRRMGTGNSLTKEIKDAISDTSPLFPSFVTVACQGVEGSNSQRACDRLIRNADIMYFSHFDAVFAAVEKGLCQYGIIPLENSTAGSVNAVYDLMQDHSFRIVRSIRLKIDHDLLAKPGTNLNDVKEIYSHEQAIAQCGRFLSSLKGVKVIPCENTAAAAKMVSESESRDKAALAAPICSRLYGLQSLKSSVQDQGSNFTRFICISKKLEIYPGADRTSLMVTLPHEQGALYKLLSRFNALGINLNKLESRPIPERDFEFRFYFDLDVPVYAPSFLQLISELDSVCESFTYLGSYSEVV